MSLERDLHSIERDDKNAAHELHLIRKILERAFPEFVHFSLFQIFYKNPSGGFMSTVGVIKGIPVGGTGTFGEQDPAGFADKPGNLRAWSTSDAVNTSLTPSADANKSQVAVAVGSGATAGGSFILSYTDTDATGNIVGTSGPVTVPFLPGTVTTPVDFAVSQLS